MDLSKIFNERIFFHELVFKDVIEKLLEAIREKGVTNEEVLLWYKAFLESACLYLNQMCNKNDQTFEGLLKLCAVTKPDEVSNLSVYDIILNDWMTERVDLVKEYQSASFNGMPEEPLLVLQAVFEELKKEDELVSTIKELMDEETPIRFRGQSVYGRTSKKIRCIEESEFRTDIVPDYVETIDIKKDPVTGTRYYIWIDCV